MPGAAELAIIALIVIVVFGVGKLGDIGGALGRGIREFRQEVEHEVNDGKPTVERLEDSDRHR
ncbi:MAG: twin-arginine translocase TatA/TatE family subunit [Anaerolineales bacterium]|nr:twin-arginine translocase TatA/TatE family subunit [Anaerolineales bacterium]MCB9127850.1 twin-arginine translocase TatA/TatE family subunit [Ardenticatenales bacterium]